MVTAVAALFATGCTEQIEPDPVPVLSGQQVYFSNDQATVFVIGKNVLGEGASSYVEIPIYRMADADECTVSMKFGTSEGFEATYDAPKFVAGQKESKLVIRFDAGQLEPGESADCIVKLDEEIASSYGKGYDELTFTISSPEPWNAVLDPVDPQINYGTYIDDFFLPLLSNPSGIAAPAYFERHADNENRIRVVEPFGAHVWTYWFGSVEAVANVVTLGSEPAYFVFDVTDPENVVMEQNPCSLGFKADFDGFVDAYIVVAAVNENNQLDPSIPGLITYNNGVISFAKGCVFMCYDDGSGQLRVFADANLEGLMQYILPGAEPVVPADYSLSVAYGGMFVATDNTANAVLDFTVGADVATYEFTVLPGNETANAQTIAESIIAGTCESDVVESDAATTQWQIKELVTGTYTVIAVAYDEEGEAQTSTANIFYFPGMGGGEETPDLNVVFAVDSVANLTGNPEHEATYPATSVAGVYFKIDDPSAVTAMRCYVNDKDMVHAGVAAGEVTLEGLADEYGQDWLEFVEGSDKGVLLTMKVEAGSNLCFSLAVESISGKTTYLHEDYQVPAAEEATPTTSSVDGVQVLKVGKVVIPFVATPMN